MLTRYFTLLAIFAMWAYAIPAHAQSGYRTINGTRVFVEVDQARGVATFSNDCGRQILTQRQLQGGAIPNDIIPCPRPSQQRREPEPSYKTGRLGNYGSIAIATKEGDLSWGATVNRGTQAEADHHAESGCERHTPHCKIAYRFWNGACGSLATGRTFTGKWAWGASSTTAGALNECQNRLRSSCSIVYSGCTSSYP